MKKIIIPLLFSLILNCQAKKKPKKLVTKHDLAKKIKLHDDDDYIKWSDLEIIAKYLEKQECVLTNTYDSCKKKLEIKK